MKKYIVKRLLWIIPIMLLISFIAFSLMYLSPGDPAVIYLSQGGDAPAAEAVEELQQKLGLDESFFTQYIRWLGKLFHGDMGTSIFYRKSGERGDLEIFSEYAEADAAGNAADIADFDPAWCLVRHTGESMAGSADSWADVCHRFSAWFFCGYAADIFFGRAAEMASNHQLRKADRDSYAGFDIGALSVSYLYPANPGSGCERVGRKLYSHGTCQRIKRTDGSVSGGVEECDAINYDRCRY